MNSSASVGINAYVKRGFAPTEEPRLPLSPAHLGASFERNQVLRHADYPYMTIPTGRIGVWGLDWFTFYFFSKKA